MSIRSRFYIALASSFVAIGAHVIADRFYLYWTIPNIDVPVHILGGIMAGLFVGVGLLIFRQPETWAKVVFFTFLIGVGWEVLEVITHAVDVTVWWYPYDTLKDLIDDIIGGTIAYFIGRKIGRKP